MNEICCPVKKPPTPVKRVTRRTAQPGEVAPIWPLTGEMRKPEHVSQQQHTTNSEMNRTSETCGASRSTCSNGTRSSN